MSEERKGNPYADGYNDCEEKLISEFVEKLNDIWERVTFFYDDDNKLVLDYIKEYEEKLK